jgi:hypothetical protein
MVKGVYAAHPEVFAPLEAHFGVNVNERLLDTNSHGPFVYHSYK